MSAASQQNGVLKVLTFTGTQPFVVRCERDTRVKDIVGAIAEIWGFKEAARLFTLCHPAPGSDLTDPTKLLPGTLLSWTDRPCQVAAAAAAAAAGSDSSHEATSVAAVTASLQPPPLLLVRYIFGSTAAEWDQNHSVLSLTAAQIAADVAAARYPGVAEAGLYQHWVKQGQHSVVLHMAASWPSGACLIVGPAHVLSGGAALQLGSAPINLGLNSKGMHIMMPHQHKLLLPLDSIASATPAGDVLNISLVSGQDLLLQLPGTEAVAEAFRVHKDAAGPRPSTQPAPTEGSVSSAAGSGPASGKRGGPHMPLWITSPTVERWLQEPTPKDDGQALSVAIQVLRPWEQTPPVLRVLLTPESTKPDDRLVEAQLLVVDADADADQDAAALAATGADGGADAPQQPGDTQDGAQDNALQRPKQKQQRIKLQLKLLPQPPAAPEPRVKLTIAPVPAAEQELLMPAPGEEPLVRLVIKLRGERVGAGGSPNNMLRMLQKGAGAQPPGIAGAGPPGIDSSDGVMLRGMQLGVGAVIGDGLSNDERPHPQLMQRLQQQQQQQQEVRQGLLAGTHLGGNMGQGQGIRVAYSSRPTYASGYRPNIASSGMQPQPPSWQQQQQYGSGMVPRPQGMRPMGAVGALPHQPYALVGPPGTVMGQQQAQHRPAMNPGHSQSRIMRPQHNQYPVHMQQPQQPQQPQQQQFAAIRQPQQVMMQQGGYMVVQQPQPQMQQAMVQQQQPQMAYAAMPQQQHQQPHQQQVMMLQANHNTAQASNNMVLVTTADGRQLLVHESQLQQPQQQQAQQLVAQPALQHAQNQQQVMSGVFVLGPHGELVPASQPAAADPNAGMQQMVLQQQAQQPHQQQPMMVAQAQGQPMFVQPTPSQKLQQFQAQQMQQVQYQQPQQAQQQQRQMGGMGGLGATGQYDQLNLMAQQQQQQQQQPQQQQLMQAQPMGMMSMDLNGQLQLQAQQQQQQQQQFMAVSSAQVGGHATQLLQLQGMQGMQGAATAMGGGQTGVVLQGQQPQQQPMQQQQQLLVANSGQQQQILVDSSNMGLLQQQVPRRSNGNMVMTSGAMFGQTVGGAPGLVSQNGPGSSGGGLGGLGLLQQGMAGTNAPGLMGISGSAAPGLGGISLGDGTLNNTSMGKGGMSAMGGVGGVGGLAAPASNYLSSFDPLQQPNSQNALNNTGLGMAAQATADPPGLNYGSSGQKQGGFLQQQAQQMQQPQQQMFTLGNAGVGGMTGLGMQDGMQGGLQVQGGLQALQAGGLQAGGLQGTVLADGYMLTHDGMTLTGGAPGLDASAFGGNQQLGQQFNATGFY